VSRVTDRRRAGRLAMAIALACLGSLAPPALYFLLRPHVHGDAVALAIAAAIPVVATLAAAVWRRQARLLSLLAVVGLGIAVSAMLVPGGRSLPLELYRPVATGIVGLALLGSAAMGRPLLVPVLRMLVRDPARRAEVDRALAPPAARHRLTIETAVFGVGLLVEAAATVVLALSVSVGVYLIASRAIRLAVLALVAMVLVGYRRHQGPLSPAGQAPGNGTSPPAREAAGGPAWFGRKRFGIGWGPRNWQGRVAVPALAAAVVVLRYAFHLHLLGR
jgi:hypothetical protein